MLKALCIVGLSMMTCLFSFALRLRTVPVDWQMTWFPSLKKETGGCAQNNVVSRGSASQAKIQEKQLFTLARLFKGSWEFVLPVYMCFVDLEKASNGVHHGIDRVFVGGTAEIWGSGAIAMSHITRMRGCVCALRGKSTSFRWVLASASLITSPGFDLEPFLSSPRNS